MSRRNAADFLGELFEYNSKCVLVTLTQRLEACSIGTCVNPNKLAQITAGQPDLRAFEVNRPTKIHIGRRLSNHQRSSEKQIRGRRRNGAWKVCDCPLAKIARAEIVGYRYRVWFSLIVWV